MFHGGFPSGLPCIDQRSHGQDVGSWEGQPKALDFYFRFDWENNPIPVFLENYFSVYVRNQVLVWWTIMYPFLKQNKGKKSVSGNMSSSTSHDLHGVFRAVSPGV